MTDDNKFYLKGGKAISDLKGLAKELLNMPSDVYDHHVNESKNDFAAWAQFSLRKEAFSKRVDGQISKIELELEVLRHLVHENEKTSKAKSDAKKKVTAKKKAVKKVVVNKVTSKPSPKKK